MNDNSYKNLKDIMGCGKGINQGIDGRETYGGQDGDRRKLTVKVIL